MATYNVIGCPYELEKNSEFTAFQNTICAYLAKTGIGFGI